MANKKYNQFTADTNPQLTDILLIADPATGALTKVTLAQLQSLIGGAAGTLATPTGLTVTAGNTQLVLDWADVANATGYSIQRATDAGFTTDLVTTTSATSNATLTGLTNGILYYVRVKATAAGYTDSPYASGTGTPAQPQLAAPTGLTVTPADSLLQLDWDNVANATGYTVQRAADAGFLSILNTTTLSGGTNSSYNQFASPNGTLFYVRVKATAAGYTDSDWATGSGTPAAAGGSYDADAQAFFTAAGITNTTQKDAVDDLVVALKAGTLWGKMKALYPFVGGSASAHKFNLKNPADTDAAYRIVFGGTVTHDANGITGDGSSGYADTKFIPNVGYTALERYTSTSHFGYVRNDVDGRLVSSFDFSDKGIMQLVPKFSGTGYFAASVSQGSNVTAANTDARGCFIVTRTASDVLKVFKNGAQLGTTNTGANSDATLHLTYPVALLCESAAGAISNFSTLNCALYGIATGLSDSEVAELNTAIVNFQTALGRNV